MKRKSTKWMALVLALVMALSLLPGAALAAVAEPSAGPDAQTQTEDTPAPTEEPEPTEEPALSEEPTPEPEASPAPVEEATPTASPAPEAEPTTEPEDAAVTNYNIWVNGEEFTSKNLAITCGSGTATLEIGNSGVYTLTLKDATINQYYTSGTSHYGIYMPKITGVSELDIVLKGTNTITISLPEGDVVFSGYGIYVNPDLMFKGDGSITVTTDGRSGSGGTTADRGSSFGIYSKKNVYVYSGTIDVSDSPSDDKGGAYSRYGIQGIEYRQYGGAVTAKSGLTNIGGYGLYFVRRVYIYGGKLTATGGNILSDDLSTPQNAIYPVAMYFKDGTTVKAGDSAESASDYTHESGTKLPGFHYITLDTGVNAAPYKLEVAGDYKTRYELGEEFDLSGVTITAYMSDNTTRTVSADEVTTNYDKNTPGDQKVTVRYWSGAPVTVTLPKKVTVGEIPSRLVDLEFVDPYNRYRVMAYDPETGEITGEFEFDPDVREYNIVANSASVLDARCTLLGYTRMYLKNPETKAYYKLSENQNSTTAAVNGYGYFWVSDTNHYSSGGNFNVGEPPRTIQLQVYDYQLSKSTREGDDEDELYNLTTYTFHIYQALSVRYDLAVTDSGETALTSIFPASLGNSAAESSTTYDTFTYRATETLQKDKTLFVKAPYLSREYTNPTNVKIFFQNKNGTWETPVDKDGSPITDPATQQCKLDLSNYTYKAETGAYELRFKYEYTGESSGTLDFREFTLNIYLYDYTPVITGQPVVKFGSESKSSFTLEKESLKDTSVSIEVADMPDGVPQGEVTYQWYGSRYLNQTVGDTPNRRFKSPISGATAATLEDLSFLLGGSTYLSCEVTRTVDGVAYTTTSTTALVKVKYPVPYLSPVGFVSAYASDVQDTCEAGTSPGTYTVKLSAQNVGTNVPKTAEGAEVAAFICRRPVGGDDSTIEVLNEVSLSRNMEVVNYLYTTYATDANQLEGELAPGLTYTTNYNQL